MAGPVTTSREVKELALAQHRRLLRGATGQVQVIALVGDVSTVDIIYYVLFCNALHVLTYTVPLPYVNRLQMTILELSTQSFRCLKR